MRQKKRLFIGLLAVVLIAVISIMLPHHSWLSHSAKDGRAPIVADALTNGAAPPLSFVARLDASMISGDSTAPNPALLLSPAGRHLLREWGRAESSTAIHALTNVAGYGTGDVAIWQRAMTYIALGVTERQGCKAAVQSLTSYAAANSHQTNKLVRQFIETAIEEDAAQAKEIIAGMATNDMPERMLMETQWMHFAQMTSAKLVQDAAARGLLREGVESVLKWKSDFLPESPLNHAIMNGLGNSWAVLDAAGPEHQGFVRINLAGYLTGMERVPSEPWVTGLTNLSPKAIDEIAARVARNLGQSLIGIPETETYKVSTREAYYAERQLKYAGSLPAGPLRNNFSYRLAMELAYTTHRWSGVAWEETTTAMAQRFYRVEPILAWTYVVNLNWFLGNGDSIPPNLRRWINQMGDQIDDIIAALPKEDGRRDIALETYCRVTRQHNLERAKAYSRLIVNPVSRERVGFFFEAHGTPVDWYKYTGEKFWIVGRQQEFPRP